MNTSGLANKNSISLRHALLAISSSSAFAALVFSANAFASCAGINNWECRFSTLNTQYSGTKAVNNDIVAGTVIGYVTVNYQYACTIPTDTSQRSIYFALATENNIRSGADLFTNVDGLTFRAAGGMSDGEQPYLTRVGGVNNRVLIDHIEPISRGADSCVEGSNNLKVFDVIKDGQITDTTHVALDFQRSVEFVTARYANASANQQKVRLFPSVATIDAAATTCVINAPTNVVFPTIATHLGDRKVTQEFKFSWTCSSIADTTTSFAAPGYTKVSSGVGIQDQTTRVVLKLKNTETDSYIPFGAEITKQLPSGGADISFTAELSQIEALKPGKFGFDVVYTTIYK